MISYDQFDITDNGDGTYSLTPKTGTRPASEIVVEYRAVRNRVKSVRAQRNLLNDKLAVLTARRDELRALILAHDPDGDQEE